MRTQWPMSESKRKRIFIKVEKAIERRMKIKKREGPELEIACAWCAIWMCATGIRQFEKTDKS